MKLRNLFYTIFAACLLISCNGKHDKFTKYVNPIIGTDAHGHVYPGAATPFGMVQLSPDTRKDNWDACSGYHYSDSTIMGFSHTHLSGTGVGDYGDVRIMPTTGTIQVQPGTEQNPETGYRSRFSHDDEYAAAGFYQVRLTDYNINVELTATPRAGFHKYTFPKSEESNIIIDLTEGVTSDKILDLWIEVMSDTEIRGLRRTDGWSDNQYVFFTAKFSKPFKKYGLVVDGNEKLITKKVQGKDVKAWLSFATERDEEVMVKVGISAVSANNAKENLEKEIPGWNIKRVKKQANKLWNDELGRIEIKDDDNENDRKNIFYTALYHALLNPNLYSDVNGEYRGHDNKIHKAEGFDYYTVFSLWDTYRAEHPLLTIIDQKRTNDFIKTMLKQYEQGGLLPVWELAANETNCMIGYHAVPVIVDAYMKGIQDYDTELALEACVASAMQDQFGLEWYKEKGYIPSNKEAESVSKTLEYAYDDWCIAQLAQKIGNQEVYNNFIKRAQNYKNIFDPETKFMRAKINESWFSPFDPWEVNFNYTEANAWQYSFYVPQDVSGLIEYVGGADSLAARLDMLFSASESTSGRQQSDITGLIGQYAHGNEPSHHIAYLYNYCGQPWKTQEKTRQILDELYTAAPDGLCGNEDCGQMSAWYVMSALGFYPLTPASNIYVVGSPVFDEVILHLENGKELIIETENQSDEDIYIQTASFNGKVLATSYLNQDMFASGGYLKFVMGKTPNKNWGSAMDQIPVSKINQSLITPVPFVVDAKNVFFNKQEIKLTCIDKNAEIRFSLDDSQVKNSVYSNPFSITNNTTLTANAISQGKEKSHEIKAEYKKIADGRSISILHPYANQYNAGGDVALIDYQRGGIDFRTGSWQGYQEVDLEAIIDLGKLQTIHELKTGFLQDVNAWIFMPEYVEYSVSDDGKNFRKIGTIKSPVAEDDWTVQTHDFRLIFKPVKTRYIKVLGKNKALCPPWHKGAGNPCWIFADEVVIE